MSRAVFLDLPERYTNPDEASISILPVPYDATSTWLKGAARGPARIMEASAHLELYDMETDSEAFRHGIVTEDAIRPAADPTEMTRQVHAAVAGLLASGRFPVVLGGEHSVTPGAVRACADCHAGLSVLQLDAHADLRETYEGSPHNHACVMARVREICPAVQVGIRSMDASERHRTHSTRLFTAREIVAGDEWFGRAIGLLSSEIYITFDLDVLDPSIMPSTGTPEPGGLSWYQSLRFLRRVTSERKVVGFDVVELCPSDSRAPDFLAAKLVYKLLTYIFPRRAPQPE